MGKTTIFTLRLRYAFNFPLWTHKAAFWTFIVSPELSAFFASPYGDFSAVWAWKLRCLASRWNSFVAAGANG